MPNTLKQFGKPVTPQTTTPANPVKGYASAGGTNVWGGGKVLTQLDLGVNCGTSTITIIDGDNTYSSTGFFCDIP